MKEPIHVDLTRREFIKLAGMTTAATAAGCLPVVTTPDTTDAGSAAGPADEVDAGVTDDVDAGPSDALVVSPVTITATTETTATVSVDISGAIPADARMLLQVAANPATGPWAESPRPLATPGNFTNTFSGLTPGTTYAARAFVFTDNGGVDDVIHAQTDVATFVTSAGEPSNVVDEMVAQMGTATADALPVLLPDNAGWANGGAITSGGDLRAIAKPTWWPGNNLADTYPWWDYLYPWHEIWDRPGHVDGLNARVAINWIELWVLYDDMPGWQRLAREVGPTGGEFYLRAAGGSPVTGSRRTDPGGAYSVTVVPQAMMFHGWGASAQARGENVVAIHTRLEHQLVLGDPAGVDDRAQARYSVHAGCDPYPRGGTVFEIPPYNPGCGISRWEPVTSEPKIAYFTTLANAQSIDSSFPFNERQTISEAAFRALPPPPP